MVKPIRVKVIGLRTIPEAPSRPYHDPAIPICRHCFEPVVSTSIVWHGYHFHVACAKKLLIVAQLSRDELVAALEGS